MSAASDKAAVVIRWVAEDMECLMLDGDGELTDWLPCQSTITQSKNLNSVFSVYSPERVPNSTGRAVRWNSRVLPGAECWMYAGGVGVEYLVTTTRWHETVSASGEARLTCHFNG
jgi:hypothetical protein